MKKKICLTITIIIFVILMAISIFLFYINMESEYAIGISFEKDTEVLGLIYLGGLESDYDYTLVDRYYTKQEQENFAIIDLGGEECYLVIPRYLTKTHINKLLMNEYGGTDKEYYMMSRLPFFIKCNASDIFPNAEIYFNRKGINYTYSPYISLKDGSVVVEDFVHLIKE
ncbi:MAG: hypothetical protein IKL68_04190 [Clostridia bacterium]|nr:hypothetical protein [Clostridia bacterium]